MLQRKLTLVEIGGSALPSPSPAAPRYANWFPMPYKAAAVPPVEGVTPNPVADGVLIEWAAVDQEGVIYVIERGPTAQGPWTEIHRTTETRYLYSDGSGQKWWFRITPTVRGKVGAGSTVEATPPTTTADLVEQQEKLAAETLARMRADAAETAARAAAMAQAAQDLLAEATLRQQQYTQAMQGIADEARARADAVLNEKLAREAAISLEQQTRQSEVDSLARQVAEVAAGSGTQFDSRAIWYFDQTVEGWSGNGTPTLVDGWLRPANAAATPWVQSPAALAVDGSAYRFVKLRVKRVGSPTWAGFLQWITPTDQTWNTQKRVAIAEPAWDANGVATVDVQDIAWWPGTVDRIRLQLGVAQAVANYYLVDWVAVGRPTPGASVALVQAETVARTNAIAAEASQRNTLAVQMRGNYTGTDPLQLTAGLAYEELKARVAADSAQVQRINAMEVRMPAGTGNLATAASVTEEALARAAADNATASTITALRADVEGKASNSALQALQSQVTLQGNDITSLGTAVTNVNASLGNMGGENLLINSSLEDRASDIVAPDWWLWGGNAPGSVRSYVDSGLSGSTKALRMAATTAASAGQYLELRTPDRAVKVVPGQKYVASAFVRNGGAAGVQPSLIIWFLDENGATVGSALQNLFTHDANTWRRIVGAPREAPANAAFARVYYRMLLPTNNAALTAQFDWDNLQFQQGEVATGWSPSGSELNSKAAANAAATSALTGTVSNLQGQVTALGQSITSVTARVDNIGGDNLLPNSGFETSNADNSTLPDWFASNSIAQAVSYGSAYAVAGSARAIQIVASAAATAVGQYIGIEVATANRPKPVPGTKYTLSAWASRMTATAGRVQLLVQWLDSNNAGIGSAQYAPIADLTATMVRYTGTFTAPTSAVSVRIFIRVASAAVGDSLAAAIDNVMFQQGEVATNWMPSGVEAAAKITANAAATSTLQGQVTSIQGTVTAQGTAITSVTAAASAADAKAVNAQAAADAAATAAGNKGKVIFQSAAPAVADRLSQNLWIDTTNNANTPKRWNGSAWVTATDKAATDAAAAAAAADAKATNAASAVTALTATVTQQGQQITAQASRIDGVQVSLGGKADASVVQEMRVQVNNQGAGGNLIANSLFPNWTGAGWTPPSRFGAMRNVTGDDIYIPYGVKSAASGLCPGVYAVGTKDWGWCTQIPVMPDKTYCMSMYVNVYRCKLTAMIEWRNASNQAISTSSSQVISHTGQTKLPLASYSRPFVIGKPPAGAVSAMVVFMLEGTGESDPYYWMWYPMFSEVAAGATQPPMYSTGGAEASAQWSLAIQANGIAAGLQLGITGETSAFNIMANAMNILSPGGADGIEMTNGYIRTWAGNSQRIIGNNFGADGLVDYFGPNVGAANASKTNATMWMDRDGNAYWGGSIAAGILRNAAQSTSIVTTGNSVLVGPFDTNGRNKQVVVGFNRRHRRIKNAQAAQGFVAGAGTNGGTINLYRQLDGQAETLWQQIPITGSVNIFNQPDGPDSADSIWNASLTLNDNTNGTTRRSYRAEIVGFTEQTVTHQSGSFDSQTITQSLSIVSIEQ
ncbi:MAG TPA: hypothetical protein DEA38_02300 [Stenotrophomonas sp.]|nr:hypothetical protein [Stenotrophomonas sp.]